MGRRSVHFSLWITISCLMSYNCSFTLSILRKCGTFVAFAALSGPLVVDAAPSLKDQLQVMQTLQNKPTEIVVVHAKRGVPLEELSLAERRLIVRGSIDSIDPCTAAPGNERDNGLFVVVSTMEKRIPVAVKRLKSNGPVIELPLAFEVLTSDVVSPFTSEEDWLKSYASHESLLVEARLDSDGILGTLAPTDRSGLAVAEATRTSNDLFARDDVRLHLMPRPSQATLRPTRPSPDIPMDRRARVRERMQTQWSTQQDARLSRRGVPRHVP